MRRRMIPTVSPPMAIRRPMAIMEAIMIMAKAMSVEVAIRRIIVVRVIVSIPGISIVVPPIRIRVVIWITTIVASIVRSIIRVAFSVLRILGILVLAGHWIWRRRRNGWCLARGHSVRSNLCPALQHGGHNLIWHSVRFQINNLCGAEIIRSGGVFDVRLDDLRIDFGFQHINNLLSARRESCHRLMLRRWSRGDLHIGRGISCCGGIRGNGLNCEGAGSDRGGEEQGPKGL